MLKSEVFEYYLYLKSLGFPSELAKYILSQAAFETANFSSNIYRSNNNLFGMKLPKKRKTYAVGEKYGHAVFNSVYDSMADYKEYWKSFKLPYSFSDLVEFVSTLKSKGYFEADLNKYIKGTDYYYKLYWNESK